jgi:aryl carrier-like protein
MVINFRARGISRSVRMLAQTPTLKKNNNNFI